MGLGVKIFPFGPTNIGKSSMLDFITSGKRPEPNPSTAYYTPFSESVVFYRQDWERVSSKMFDRVIPDFVDWMMEDAVPENRPELKNTYLASCNRDAVDEGALIKDLDEPYTIVEFSGPDTGGQERYESILPQVAHFCDEHSIYPCFRNIPGNVEDLKGKLRLVDEQLGSEYKWNGAYIQLQLDEDERISSEQEQDLRSVKELPVHYVSSKEMNRYDVMDVFVIHALVPLVTK